MISENTLPKPKIYKKILISCGVVCVCLLGLAAYVYSWEHRPAILEVYFFDMAHGSAVFVRTPDERTTLIGAGQGAEILRKLAEVMPFYRRHIDNLVVPLAADSVPGLIDVLSRYDVGKVFSVATSSSGLDISATSSLSEALILKHLTMQVLTEEKIGNSANLDGPIAKLTAQDGALRLAYGSSSFLIADSVARKDQQDMPAQDASAEVLQLRSAANTKVSNDFMSTVSPKYLVISKMPTRPKVQKLKVTSQTQTASSTMTLVAPLTVTKASKLNTSKKIITPKIKKLKKQTKLATSTKPLKPSKKLKSPKPPKQPKPAKPKKPKATQFDVYSLPKSIKVIPLDREGTTKFVSDGVETKLIK